MTDRLESPVLLSRRRLLLGSAVAAGLASAGAAFTPAANAATYVRPIRDAGAHPITAQWRQPGSWAAGYHTGVDIGCPIGTPVYATIGGDVRTGRANWGSAYGTMILINDNVDGSDWGYCHLSRRVVSDGQRVATNQLIGYSGNTGNTTGPHLHLERRPRYGGYGSDLNPNLWP
ncbi:Peptidase M23 OS=Tsukamurella paurometabola (strain ATCC 8368 / DSM / CCUG 35730 / CIP 100753/ JCM 10117 / KCTC 9821 / NBRC 16120 / NCIMB 702349 / NCTC 13040) OX=521096 GN=Tpau_2320 PE=4 SV=1 [Tsukamurella paurometabola]|uniref:Peptidase M23 n=1 Tax=Tsukamurella paurometabola (strain ATCC 8368 / DSM 20162 / CCUG 35730 / CIP 100753 / JCM 10117 / KCTC 9821 / NBRC 16120 / NCIMB 702349 / NCTC 13040) TaxID=521096 RepID=D5UQF7_TSUPD|nr:M23 family metallopeptidase [Tsukamurella paurometabola]ADG78927.1 Peptidase M23 [Tsukamurella paurometabola DSM 20162]SUP33532.1 Glycyl-glycine endopeptidase ALE-1 precursor [Tsukamurella paurometabola]